ncbi:MAG: hypothetical protein AAFX87_21865 [Bacteroidota bacterium]
MKRSKPTFDFTKLFFLIGIGVAIPALVYAQNGQEDIEMAMAVNAGIVDWVSLLSPTAISPFWTLFLTSLASNTGLATDYVATHPFLGSSIIMVLSGLLVLVTTIPNLSKVSKPLGLTANYLEDKSGYIIYGLILLAPYLAGVGETPEEQTTVKLAFLDVPFVVVLFAVAAIPYLLVVMTVRYFLEVLIFLSPIPLLDAFFDFLKKSFTVGLVVTYFIFPPLAFVFAILIFLVALVLFRRSRRVTTYFQYIYVNPLIIKLFGRKKELISSKLPTRLKRKYPGIKLALECLNMQKTGELKPKNRIWLISADEGIVVCHISTFGGNKAVKLSGEGTSSLTIGHDLYYKTITTDDGQVKLLLNAAHNSLAEEIIETLGAKDIGKVGIAKAKAEAAEKARKGFRKILGFFSSRSIAQDKQSMLK